MRSIALLRRGLRPLLPSGVRAWLRRWVLGEVGESREALNYEEGSRLGHDSDNEWIRKSSTIGGWIFEGEHEVLWDLATREGRGDILEIGSWMGKSTCILAGACKERLPQTRVYCVDPFDLSGAPAQEAYHRRLVADASGTFYQFLENARRHDFESHVVPIGARSEQALPGLGLRLRMIFVDGAHDFDSVDRDVRLSLPMLEEGGVLVLHDCDDPHWPDVERYVQEHLSQHPGLSLHRRFRSLAVFVKRPED